ncbi:hypothetical protein [Kineococcus terrestris]|uniref:hypothetical protein n=1 Tax=Kineococcus terrestris TaxID=2044856 RepID=UPI0034DAFCBC
MRVDRAFAVLPVPGPQVTLDRCLEHLVAAADEAAASGVETTVLLAVAGAGAAARALADWTPLVEVVDGVDLAAVVAGEDAPPGALLTAGAREALRRSAVPATALLLTTSPASAVGTGWVLEHARHHRGGALASTGPVRGGAGGRAHPVTANLAVRLSVCAAAGWAGELPPRGTALVHAVTPVVGSLLTGSRLPS